MTGEGHSIRLRETAHISADKVALEYEITPEQTVDTEVVLLQGTMPAAIHAGKTSYLVIDGGSATRGTCPAELNNDSYIVFGGVAADWIGFTRPGGSGLRVTPGQVSLQFQDNRKWSTPAFALLATGAGGRLAAGKPIRFTCTFAAEAAVKLEADARDAGKGGLAGMTLTDHRPLSIRAVALDKTSVETYEPMEATADIAATYDNPFDPDKIAVDAEVTDPAGRTIIVPGFYGVTMRVETIRQTERLVGASAPRFPGAAALPVKREASSGLEGHRPERLGSLCTAGIDGEAGPESGVHPRRQGLAARCYSRLRAADRISR